jgi:hypothetical protein
VPRFGACRPACERRYGHCGAKDKKKAAHTNVPPSILRMIRVSPYHDGAIVRLGGRETK